MNIEKQFVENDVSAMQEIDHLMAGELYPDPPREEFKYELRQWFTAFGAIIGSILAGVTGGFSAVLIPQLDVNSTLFNNTNFTKNLFESFEEITIQTTTQKSWLGFSGALLLAPGCWLSGLLIEKLGRRMTHLVIIPFYFLSWLTISVSPNFSILVFGRLFTGFSMGLLAPACPVYIAETTNPRLRGILLGCISVAASFGNLLAHSTGILLHWRMASLCCGSLNIICFILCFFSPESPTWFLKKGKIEKASTAWKLLKGPDFHKEFQALKFAHAPKYLQQKKTKDWMKIITLKSFLKPLGIVCLLFFTAQCCGVASITFYSVDIFTQVSDPKGAFMWTLITDLVKVSVSGFSCWLIKRVSNRGLALFSGFGTALVLFILAGVQYYDVGNPWTPVVLIIAYNIASFIGLVPLSWMLCGELFPVAYKGLGTGLTSGFGFLCLFLVVLLAPYMFEYFLAYGTFFIYGCIAAVGTSVLFFYLPETRGKTLLEIELSFKKTKSDLKLKNKYETNVEA